MKLEAVPVGFRDIYEGTGDEDFENPTIVAVSGNATQSVVKTAKAKLELTVNGDGDVANDDGDPANNAFQVKVDAHIGAGEVDLVTGFEYNVVSKDATLVTFTKVRREPIPATP